MEGLLLIECETVLRENAASRCPQKKAVVCDTVKSMTDSILYTAGWQRGGLQTSL